ncbi:MAG: hypothetical protein LQ345_005120 [Seirophora villosa]|nr:MAG: hypothetical protein LQ345_005120 [Seirophora villosa]
MLASNHLSKWVICLLLTIASAAASPATAPPACGGNPCYPVLLGPILKPIAKDYCSYYLKYPRTTTVTVKTTSTATKAVIQPPQTVTVTETATVDAMQKRDPSPLFTPPKGSGHDYKPPLLLGFAPAVISAACSCIVTPTTITVTSTSEATATATETVTKPAITTTVATVTDVVTVTVISVETVSNPELHANSSYHFPPGQSKLISVSQFTAAPSTSTTTESTTTTAVPVQTCNGVPGLPQQSVTGFLQPRATQFPPRILTPTLVDPSAEVCYNTCRSFRPPGGAPNPIKAYSFNPTQTKPLQDLPGNCVCYSEQLCSFFTNDPAGDTIGGDTQLPFQ